MIAKLRQTLRDRAAYRKTVREIRSLPIDIALDLDIYPGDAEPIARQAVYGR
jgi:hypothetical protein